jgi:hypothetical protein
MGKKTKEIPENAQTPCPICVELYVEGHMEREAIQPLRGGAMDGMSLDGRKQCKDCDFAGTLGRFALKGMPFHACRLTVANHRRESMRLPGVAIGLGLSGARTSVPGELEKHQAWLDACVPSVDESCFGVIDKIPHIPPGVDPLEFIRAQFANDDEDDDSDDPFDYK